MTGKTEDRQPPKSVDFQRDTIQWAFNFEYELSHLDDRTDGEDWIEELITAHKKEVEDAGR